jgi:hypothetical protein
MIPAIGDDEPAFHASVYTAVVRLLELTLFRIGNAELR